MSTPRFPSLAGVCTHEEAARLGYSVDRVTTVLLRFAYVKQRLAILGAMSLPSTPEWEVKGALALHAWLDAEHASLFYRRIAELRRPPPSMDDVPDARLEAALDEAQASASTSELVTAVYGVLRPALAAAFERYLTETNALCDHPTCRLLRHVVHEEREIGGWGAAALAAVRERSVEAAEECARWAGHLRAYLAAAGGIAGDAIRPPSELPLARATTIDEIDVTPVRQPGSIGVFDTSTPADIVYLDEERGADERNAALLFKRLREMDVPEVIGGIVAQRWSEARNRRRHAHITRPRPSAGPPSTPPKPPAPSPEPPASPQPLERWSYYTNMLRQMWDEARHSMLGEAVLEARGLDWRRLPINATFSYKLARFCSPIERHILLYAIEQSLMPRARGKPYEHAVATASGDPLSALFHDFDWADEVLHVDIARRCLRPELPGGLAEARARADRLWQRIAVELERNPLPRDTTARADWWGQFAKAVTGRDVAPVPATHVKDWRPLSG